MGHSDNESCADAIGKRFVSVAVDWEGLVERFLEIQRRQKRTRIKSTFHFRKKLARKEQGIMKVKKRERFFVMS